MLNFFGVDVTEDKNNKENAGRVFCVRRTSSDKTARVDRVLENEEELMKEQRLPLPLSIFDHVSSLGVLAAVVLFVRALADKVPFSTIYSRAPQLVWALILCIILKVVLRVVSARRIKDYAESPEFTAHKEKADDLMEDIKEGLEIPKDAKTVEIMAERFVMKNGEPRHRDFGINEYINVEVWTYIKDGKLCLADIYHVWEMDLSSLKSIEFVNRKICFPNWFKEEAYNSQKYKQYKITVNNFGQYFAKHYRVNISDPLGDFYFLIPEYDGQTFMEITGIKEADGDRHEHA